ncbi:MAG TPA: helix-turn-helix domain-containing protein [Anaeromyxobacter sp.]|nr:helix-turn-helix domain-containing protein [Anaeromyxobacter sp.]
MVETGELLSTREVAHLAGVGPTAVKRWADAGLLACVRTVGRHRRFTRSEVERFLGAHTAASEPAGREPWVGALLEADDPLALEALLLSERAHAGAWYRVAALTGRALTEVGRLWSAGAVTIFEEHQASERLARSLHRITDGLPLAPRAPRALLACAEGDDHTLGLSLTELVLREAGWASVWAGRRTPFAELGPALARSRSRLIAVSASAGSSDAVALREQAAELGRIARVHGAALALGGRGAWPDRPRHGARFTDFEPFQRWANAEREHLAGG